MLNEFNSKDNILIVGDGDFSFSKALINNFSSNSSLGTVTSSVFDDESTCYSIYLEAEQNAAILRSSGVKVLFNIDATALQKYDLIADEIFDRIVFNFPHTGGKTNLKKCKLLLKNVFLSCSNLLSRDVGRFYLTLAQGQSGIDGDNDDLISVDDDCLPNHKMDSWQAIYLSSYADLNLEKILPFDVERLISLGYKCTGYKNRSQKFRVENAQTLVFRISPSVNVKNLYLLNDEINYTDLTNFRPFYVHDIAFWVDKDEFDEKSFSEMCRRFSKGLIKRIKILPGYSMNDDRYADKNLQTLCFRLIWQSCNYSLTRENCRDLQIMLRNYLTDAMPEKLSFTLR